MLCEGGSGRGLEPLVAHRVVRAQSFLGVPLQTLRHEVHELLVDATHGCSQVLRARLALSALAVGDAPRVSSGVCKSNVMIESVVEIVFEFFNYYILILRAQTSSSSTCRK